MIEQFEFVAKAIADRSRVRILKMLESGALCVCRITMALDLAPATVSKHLSVLKSAGLIMSEKRGRWAYYRLADREVNPYAPAVLAVVGAALAEDPVVLADRRALDSLAAIPAERLCDEGPAVLAGLDRHGLATQERYKEATPTG
jgi:DNA-binding transcriptional ArsR family regulator